MEETKASRKSGKPDLSDPLQVEEIIEKFAPRKSSTMTADNLQQLDSQGTTKKGNSGGTSSNFD